MSECSHNCEECGVEGCSSRIEKLVVNNKSKIKHTIAIVSGKGGVGKSLVTSLLASYLNKDGKSVGILDGDITGPSIPKSFNIHEPAYGDGGNLILPATTKNGIKIISSNMLVQNEDDPIIWRGSLITTLLGQFYKDVIWGELEYLLIDMPPGTSDVTLTAFQQIPLDGIIIVTSPQDLVSLIVKKAINMAKVMNIPILGIIENMSYVECPTCKEKIYVYGKSKLQSFAKENDLEILGQLPLRSGVTELIDAGNIEEVEMKEIIKAKDVLINLK